MPDCCCGDSGGPCPRCGTCSKTWNEGVDEFGEAFGYWSTNVDEDGFACSGAVTLDSGQERLIANGALCSCLIAARGGETNGETISGLCTTFNQGFCRCCTATYESGAWVKDEGCAATHNGIIAYGGGFVVRATCACPDPVGEGTEGETVQLVCVESYYCDWDEGITPNNDCTDP